MNITLWIMIIIGVILLALMVLFLITVKKGKRTTDYYSLYVIGISWIPLGLILNNMAFFILGLVFMSVGLAHRSEWEKNHVPWRKLSEKERKIKGIIIALLMFLVLAGLVFLLLR